LASSIFYLQSPIFSQEEMMAQTKALVLSGGGRGAYHIGVIESLVALRGPRRRARIACPRKRAG